MKKKKIIPLLPLALLALSSNAGTMGEDENAGLFSGWYIGAEGGMLNTLNAINQNTYYTSFPASLDINTNNQELNQTNNYGTGLFSLGLGKVFNNTEYLGLEASLSIANKNSSYNDDMLITTIETDRTLIQTNYLQAKLNYAEFDLDVKFGTQLHETTLLYGRVGAAFNHAYLTDYYSVYETRLKFGTLNTSYGDLNLKPGNNILGLRLGLGVEQALMHCLSIKLDYVATWYQGIKTSGSSDLIWEDLPDYPILLNGIQTNINSRLMTQAIMLGANLYLDDLFN